MRLDPNVLAHLEWLGYVQPTGLVVSAPALVRAGAILDRSDTEGQRRLRECVEEPSAPARAAIADFPDFAFAACSAGASRRGLRGTAEAPIPPELEVALPEHGETLRPDYAVRERDPATARPRGSCSCACRTGAALDERGSRWARGAVHGRMERMLRETGVPAGLLCQRAVAAADLGAARRELGLPRLPRRAHGADRGRPICERAAPAAQRAPPARAPASPAPRRAARRQPQVPERGQRAARRAGAARPLELLAASRPRTTPPAGSCCANRSPKNPTRSTARCSRCILRLVFLLYAEERGHAAGRRDVPAATTRSRACTSAFARTPRATPTRWTSASARGPAARPLPARPRRRAHGGAVELPARHGELFDPDRFPFLEGRAAAGARQVHERIEPPLVPGRDGLPRAREAARPRRRAALLPRARRRADRLGLRDDDGLPAETRHRDVARGASAAKKHGAPSAVDLDALLDRARQAREVGAGPHRPQAHRKGRPRQSKDAATLEDLHAALLPVADRRRYAGPRAGRRNGPAAERGAPSVGLALHAALADRADRARRRCSRCSTRLRGEDGSPPRPEQILELKVCDPAMGSGAFLVEACRQLGDALVDAWARARRAARDPARRGRGDPRTAARRAALPLRRRQEPGGGRSGEAVAVARDAGARARAYVRRPRPAPRRLAGGLDASPDRGLPLGRVGRGLRGGSHRRAPRPRARPEGPDPLSGRGRDRRCAARHVGRGAGRGAPHRLFGDLVVLAYFSGAKASERETARATFAHAVSAGSRT